MQNSQSSGITPGLILIHRKTEMHKEVEEVNYMYPLGDNNHCIDKKTFNFKSTLNGNVSTDSNGQVDDI